MTNTINFDSIEAYASGVSGALAYHDAGAKFFESSVKEILAEHFVAAIDINTANDAMTDLGRRTLIAIAEVRQHITTLEAQKVTAVANVINEVPVEERDLPENAGVIQRRRSQVGSEYDVIIEQLREKDRQLTNFAETSVRAYLNHFQDGKERLTRSIAAINRLYHYQAGYAYVSIRLAHYVKSVQDYVASARSGEANAINDFNAALDWFESPEGIEASNGLVDYAAAVREATVPPTLAELGVTPPIAPFDFNGNSSDGMGDETSGDAVTGGPVPVSDPAVQDLLAQRRAINEEFLAGPSPERITELQAEARRIDGQLDALGYSVNNDSGTPVLTPNSGVGQTDAGYRYELQQDYDSTVAEIERLEDQRDDLIAQAYINAGSGNPEQSSFIERQLGVNQNALDELRRELGYIEEDIRHAS